MTLFLTPTDLADLTGYKQPAAQKRWLAENGYSFEVRADGRPRVMVDQVRERQCKGAAVKTGPKLAALDKLGWRE